MRWIAIVRLAICLATLLGLTGVAGACPPAAACLAKLRAGLREPLPPADPPVAPALTSVTRSLQLPLVTRRAAEPVQMPWIWGAVRARVHSRLPSYRGRNDITVVLSPVVVASPSDTVPGLGIAGAF